MIDWKKERKVKCLFFEREIYNVCHIICLISVSEIENNLFPLISNKFYVKEDISTMNQFIGI